MCARRRCSSSRRPRSPRYAGYADSLGEIVNNEAGYHLSGVLGAAICIAAMAIVIEVVLALVQRALTPAPLRRAEALALPDELIGRRRSRPYDAQTLLRLTNETKQEEA